MLVSGRKSDRSLRCQDGRADEAEFAYGLTFPDKDAEVYAPYV